MPEPITIEYDDKEARLFIENLGKNIEEIEEPLRKSADFMVMEATANFPAKGLIFGKRWNKWAKTTKQVREGKISFRTIKGRVVPVSPRPEDVRAIGLMEKTGTLKESFVIGVPKISKNHGEIEVYNPTPYAKYHQEGATLWTGAKLPKRVLLKIAKRQADNILKIFSEWLNKVIQKS